MCFFGRPILCLIVDLCRASWGSKTDLTSVAVLERRALKLWKVVKNSEKEYWEGNMQWHPHPKLYLLYRLLWSSYKKRSFQTAFYHFKLYTLPVSNWKLTFLLVFAKKNQEAVTVYDKKVRDLSFVIYDSLETFERGTFAQVSVRLLFSLWQKQWVENCPFTQ